MLTQERFEEIVRIVTRDGAATVPELARLLETSESTIRRDLVQLDSLGKVRKVHGGATAVREAEPVQERNMQEKYSRNIEDKRTIAAYAATLVRPNDFVFLDAGSTTEQLATYLTEKDAVYVTNGITLAQKLAQRGLKTLLIAGRVKATTDAVIGTEAVASLQHYNPVIDETVSRLFSLPAGWKLIAQMPFSGIVSEPQAKEKEDISKRVLIFR